MHCPICQADSKVADSRPADGGSAVRRRRECVECGHRFTTYERREPARLAVSKRDGSREAFDPRKLRAALLGAAHKRDIPRSEVEAIVDAAEGAIAAAGGSLPSAAIAELCLERLRELDMGAFLQFAGTLPQPNAHFAGLDSDGSVRAVREHAELPPKAATRRRSDG